MCNHALRMHQAKKAADLYRAGLSLRQVAEQFGVSRKAVRSALKLLDVPRRPKGWATARAGIAHARVAAAFAQARASRAVDQTGEDAARAIYDGWKDQPGWVPWSNDGNSLKQDEARRLAAMSQESTHGR